jgi:sigma-B regulation protein RsbU (phosphoserine phosphatase)
MLTSRSDREDVAAGMAAGADDLLIKPIGRDDLEARLTVARRIVSLQMELATRNHELSAVNERMRQDLQAAVRVQEALLPVHLPQVPGVDSAWLYRPCDQLGGDTLNLYRLDEQHLGFYVLDVSGHGVSSALLAVQVSRFLSPLIAAGALPKRAIVERPGYRLATPLEVVRELNHLFPMSDTAMQYFTIIFGHYHLPSHTVRLAAAGHPGPIVTHADGTWTTHDLAGNPIGFFPNDQAQFAETEIALRPGDRIHFFSDGVIETMGENQNIIGPERLAAILAAAPGRPSAAHEHLVAALAHWRAGAPPTDDVSVITLERTP